MVSVEYYLNFSVHTSVNSLVKRGMGDLAYLFLPEDTTDNIDRKGKDSIILVKNSSRSTVKVVFWIVVSITISLVLGQLK